MILAIETSCDDSAVAILREDGSVVANEISSQINVHEKYGGVVPEIASRSHLLSLPTLLREVMEKYEVKLSDLSAIAVTYAPGLVGSLLVGVSYAKTLAWTAGIPLIPIDHLEGHLLAPFIDNPKLEFPYLGLIASGGHTHLVMAEKLGEYKLLGKTIDDAAGEAFDKVAKMLGFKYPGGPLIDKIAAECPNPTIEFPIPLRGKKTLNFSYSGLKTAVKNQAIADGVYVANEELIGWEEYQKWPESERKDKVRNIIASFRYTIAKTIALRCNEALKQTGLKNLVLSGGVAANSEIRRQLTEVAKKRKINFYYPTLKNCTDNAAMIAYTALQYYKAGRYDKTADLALNASSSSPLRELQLHKKD